MSISEKQRNNQGVRQHLWIIQAEHAKKQYERINGEETCGNSKLICYWPSLQPPQPGSALSKQHIVILVGLSVSGVKAAVRVYVPTDQGRFAAGAT